MQEDTTVDMATVNLEDLEETPQKLHGIEQQRKYRNKPIAFRLPQ